MKASPEEFSWFDSWGEGPLSTDDVMNTVILAGNPEHAARQYHITVSGMHVTFAEYLSYVERMDSEHTELALV